MTSVSSTSSTASSTGSTTASTVSSVVSSTAQTVLTSLGAGSDIDISALATNLTTASFSSAEGTLSTKESANSAKISSLATIKSNLDTFVSALNSLVSGGTLATTPSSSDTSVLSATATSGAHVGDVSAAILVTNVAKAQSVSSVAVTDPTQAIGQGGITLTVGGKDYPLTIDSSNDSLNGLAAAITGAKAGVTASVVNTNGKYQLIVKGQTGTANAFTLTSTATTGLAGYAYPGGTGGKMSIAQGAEDATLKMDGVTITRASNTISDLIPGVTLTVNKTSTTAVSLTSTRPTAAITQAVTDFVDTYNALKKVIDAETAASTTSTAAGALNGNAAIKSIQTQLAKLTATKLSSYGDYSTLAEIGVATGNDGTLSVDATKLSAALAADPDGVEAMFNPGQWSSNALLSISSSYGATKPGSYAVTNAIPATSTTSASATIDGTAALASGSRVAAKYGTAAYGLKFDVLGTVASGTINVDLGISGALSALVAALEGTSGGLTGLSSTLTKETDTLATQRSDLEDKESAYKDRISTQLTAMQTAVSSYKSIQSYLEQQVAVWTKSNN